MNTPRIFEVVARAPYMVGWPSGNPGLRPEKMRRRIEDMTSALNSQKCMVVCCDSACEQQSPLDLPVSPPFDYVWLETISARRRAVRNGEERPFRLGAAVQSSRTDGGGWECYASVFLSDTDVMAMVIGVMRWTLDAEGRLGPEGDVANYMPPGGEPVYITEADGSDREESYRDFFDGFLGSVMNAICYTFAMLHCKNVTAIHGGYSDDGLTNRQKREPGRGHIEYKVLKVRVGKGREYVLGRGTAGEAIDLPLHMVRGHFKTYTPERPLLKKHVGTYWWPAHARGDRKNGEIRKRYDVDTDGPAGVAA